jgi:Trk K+ transport system NAD-binding subunit
LQTVVESVTTAGFGGHAPWTSDILNALVIVMNLTGVTIFFFTIPLIVTPYLRKTLSKPPTSTSKKNHIVVVSDEYSSNKSLMKELSNIEDSYVFVENDKERASELYSQNIPVVNSNPGTQEGLEAANLSQATSVITDVSDKSNLTVIYLAKQINPEVRRIAVVGDDKSESLCHSAGADDVFNLAEEVGMILSEHSVSTFSKRFENVMKNHHQFEITKLVVFQNSPITGMKLENFSNQYLGEQNVIAGHFGNEFIVSPDTDDRIKPNSLIYIAGKLDNDIEKTESYRLKDSKGDKILICGNGRVGSKVSEYVESEGYKSVTIDKDSDTNPDIVGDASDKESFEDINFDDYKTIVMSIDDDVAATYACTIISDITEDVKIVSRANDTGSVQSMYLAGADQVILIPRIMDSHWSSVLGRKSQMYNLHNQIDMDIIENEKYEDVPLSNTDIGDDIGSRIVSVRDEGVWKSSELHNTKLNKGDLMIAIGTTKEVEATRKKLRDEE